MAKRKGLTMLRAEHGLDQQTIATRCGVSRTTYCQIENGKLAGKMPFWQRLQKEFGLTDAQIWAIIKGDKL